MCATCRGTGFVRTGVLEPDTVVSHGWRDVTVPCRDCAEERSEERRLMAWSGIPVSDMTFANYRAVTLEAGNAKRAAVLWAVSEGQPWLFLYGSRGTGKTHLATAAARACIEQRLSVAFYLVPELLGQLGEAVGQDQRAERDGDPEPSRYHAIRHRLLDADVLVLDDLGTERRTEFAVERLYEAIGQRYAAQKRLIVTTNAAPLDLDPRVMSRLQDVRCCTRIRMEWSDYRSTP